MDCYDIFFRIFEFLEFDDLLNCSLVSIFFNCVSRDKLLWKRLSKNVEILYNDSSSYKQNLVRTIYIRKIKRFGTNVHWTEKFGKPQISIILPKTLTNLLILSLENCNLSYVPESLISLVTLKISGNKVQKIPETLTNLQVLIARRNRIKQIPSSLASLNEIDLSFNHINGTLVIPNFITSVNVSHNYLKTVPENVRDLNISHNNIETICNIPKSLRKLDLACNDIKKFLCTTNFLTLLDLYGNDNIETMVLCEFYLNTIIVSSRNVRIKRINPYTKIITKEFVFDQLKMKKRERRFWFFTH